MVLDEPAGVVGVDPEAVAVWTLIEQQFLPLPSDQIVSARRAFPDMRLSLRGETLVPGGVPLLAEEVGLAAGEVLGLVAVEIDAVRHIDVPSPCVFDL